MSITNTKYNIEQEYKYQGKDWWSWWIWIEGNESDLDQIDYVIYTLHSTFRNPVRKIKDRKTKFKLESDGWGVFTIYAKIVLHDSSEISLKHNLRLAYPDGTENFE